jgi:hypothetical protein
MRDKITISLSLVALVIVALSLLTEWGRPSQVFLIAAGILILAKWIPFWVWPVARTVGEQTPEPSQAINAVGWLGLLFAVTGATFKFLSASPQYQLRPK